MRLIDADVLKDEIRKYANEPSKLRDRRWDTRCTAIIADMNGLINEMPTIQPDAPTVDAEPVRHGRWVTEWTGEIMIVDGVKSELGIVRCSICGGDQVKENYKFCPWCGAKMNVK